jgi:hypothetical protein
MNIETSNVKCRKNNKKLLKSVIEYLWGKKPDTPLQWMPAAAKEGASQRFQLPFNQLTGNVPRRFPQGALKRGALPISPH